MPPSTPDGGYGAHAAPPTAAQREGQAIREMLDQYPERPTRSEQRGVMDLAESLIREAGDSQLGEDVKGLSQALHDLTVVRETKLTPARVATMTVEDVPELLTPVAGALGKVLKAGEALQQRLHTIEDDSSQMLPPAAAKGNAELQVARANCGGELAVVATFASSGLASDLPAPAACATLAPSSCGILAAESDWRCRQRQHADFL